MPAGTGNIGAFDGCGVQRFPIESCVGRRAGGGNDRRRRRCACAAAEPGAAQRAALVLPERLHGTLLVGADRRRAGAQLFETAHAGAFGRMPERGERDQPGSTCASRRSARGRSSGPAAGDASGARTAAYDASGARRTAGPPRASRARRNARLRPRRSAGPAAPTTACIARALLRAARRRSRA